VVVTQINSIQFETTIIIKAMLFDEEFAAREEGLDESTTRTFFFPGGLDEPITDTSLLFYQWALGGKDSKPTRLASGARCGRQIRFIQECKAEFPRCPIKVATETGWAKLANQITELADSSRALPAMRASITRCKQAVELVQESLRSSLETQYEIQLPAAAPRSRYESIYCRVHDKLQRAVWRLQRLSAENAQESFTVGLEFVGLILLVNQHSVAQFDVSSKSVMVGPIALFLNLASAVNVRYTCLMANRLLHRMRENIIVEVFRWQDSVVSIHNRAYEVVKSLESLSKCYISTISGGDLDTVGAYGRMREKVAKKLRAVLAVPGAYQPAPSLSINDQAFGVLDRLDSVLRSCSLQEVVEIFGLQKTTGFPIVYVREGGKTVHDGASGEALLSPYSVLRSEWIYCHLTLKNFVARTGSWPSLSFSKDDLKLEEMYKRGQATITDNEYHIAEWAHVEFGQMYEFNMYQDLTPFILDKACAPAFEETRRIYRGETQSGVNRRVVTATLASTLSAEKMLNSWANDEYEHSESRPLVLLKPKEKEFKVAPRMFCMVQLRWRYPLGIIQSNVKSGPFQDLPYQTMTMGRTEQQLHLHSLVGVPPRHISGEPCFRLYIEIDFSKWNNKFRDVLISRYGRRMDQQFGVRGVFGKIHKFFRSCDVALFTPGERVELFEAFVRSEAKSDSSAWWNDHDGGIEGIDQATWTAATISMIYEAIGFEGNSFKLVGQGDNQVLVVDLLDVPMSDRKTARSRASYIMSRIDIVSRFLNHEAKPDEFLESTSTFTYSKQVYVNGVEYPTELKFASKVGPFSSAERLSAAEMIGAIYSGASASAERAEMPLLHYMLAVEIAGETLDRMSVESPIPDDQSTLWLTSAGVQEIALALTVGSPIGGLPIMSPTAFMIRGEPDALGSALAGLKLLGSASKVFRKPFEFLSRPSSFRTFKSERAARSALILDPESIPVRRLAGGAAIIESSAMEALSAITTNPEFQEIIEPTKEASVSTLEDILQMEPFYPHVAADLYKLSRPGTTTKYSKKFSYSRTIAVAARSQAGVGGSAIRADSRAFASTLMILSKMAEEQGTFVQAVPSSILELTSKYRLRWGLGHLLGVSTTHPIDYPLSTDLRLPGIKIISPWRSPGKRARGPLTPFIGGHTDDRVSGKTWEVMDTSGIEDLRKAVVAYTSGNMEGCLPLFENILAGRGLTSMDAAIELLPRTIGGSIAHRYAGYDKTTRSGPIGTINVATHYELVTDDIPGLCGKSVDKPLPIQSFFSWLLGVARHKRHLPEALVSLVDATLLPDLVDEPTQLTAPPKSRLKPPKTHIMKIEQPYLKPVVAPKMDVPEIGGYDRPLTVKEAGDLLTSLIADAAQSGRGSTLDTTMLHASTTGSTGVGVAEISHLPVKTVLTAIARASFIVSCDLFLRERSHEDLSKDLTVAIDLGVELCTNSFQSLAKVGTINMHLIQCTRTHPLMVSGGLSSLQLLTKNTIIDSLSGSASWSILETLAAIPPIFNGPGGLPAKSTMRRLAPAIVLIGLAVSTDDRADDWFSLGLSIAKGLASTLRYVGRENMMVSYNVLDSIRNLAIACSALTSDPGNPRLRTRYLASKLTSVSKVRRYRSDPLTEARRLRGVLTSGREVLMGGGDKACPVEVVNEGKVTLAFVHKAPLGMKILSREMVNEDTSSEHSGLEQRQRSRCSAGFGLCTSIIPRWITILTHVLNKLPPNAQCDNGGGWSVIGTGRGSIQSALAILGWGSMGYDLPEAISPSIISRPNPCAPEVWNLGLAETAKYGNQPAINWLRPRANELRICREASCGLIIDIEGGSKRFRDEVLTPLSMTAPHRPTIVIAKFLLTVDELDGLTTWLAAEDGVSNLSAIMIDDPRLGTSYPVHVVVSFIWSACLKMMTLDPRTVNRAIETDVCVITRVAKVEMLDRSSLSMVWARAYHNSAIPAIPDTSNIHTLGLLAKGMCQQSRSQAFFTVTEGGSRRRIGVWERATDISEAITATLSCLEKKLNEEGLGWAASLDIHDVGVNIDSVGSSRVVGRMIPIVCRTIRELSIPCETETRREGLRRVNQLVYFKKSAIQLVCAILDCSELPTPVDEPHSGPIEILKTSEIDWADDVEDELF